MNKSNIDRSTPFDADAEAAVLGSALLDGLRLMPVLQGSLRRWNHSTPRNLLLSTL